MGIRVGTASWTDKTLIDSKLFYPKGCTSAEARLRYFSSQFNLVEVDSSYYAMPSGINARLWVERTPADFVFNIKSFRLFTGHQTPRIALPKDIEAALPKSSKKNVYLKDFPPELLDEMWRRYAEGIRPLKEGGKLGAVHFQFAPWVTSAPEGQALVRECVGRLPDYTLAVEFRNKSWFDGEERTHETLALERELAVVNVTVDEPQGMPNTIPAVWGVTHPSKALVRLHGRNHETWNIKGATAASDRFNYDYTDEELESLAGNIRNLAASVADAQVVFNNNFADQGIRNARSLIKILGLPHPSDDLF
ncbi:DUF72 domain-containing protein [Burkholderia cenocepacia]|uniref:DUF72 domain-containing protein n=1 Tax=Burkholderia cenocepacia TaxID=95486 RepID=UPI000761305E|nr:DUF72 domain-containing protein [Burkholderia cenocepacia]KWU26453.1 hypothetical protein AS149_25390 [Burkholderia cenocepacia]